LIDTQLSTTIGLPEKYKSHDIIHDKTSTNSQCEFLWQDKIKVTSQYRWPLNRVDHMDRFDCIRFIQMVPPIHNVSTIVDFNLICATMYYLFKFACQLYNFISRYSNEWHYNKCLIKLKSQLYKLTAKCHKLTAKCRQLS
jgi:hypothetical protein